MRTVSQESSTNSRNVQLLQAIGGGFSGAVTRFVTQPFDVLKIRFQLQVEPLSKKSRNSKYAGMMHAFFAIYKEEGIRGMWKGHNAAQAMSISYALMQFWAYEQLHRAIGQTEFYKDHHHLSYFLCGGMAGTCGTLLAQPFDVIRTRVVAADPGSNASRLSPLFGVGRVFKKEGVRGITSGMMLTLLQIYPLVGANFVIYKFFNHLALQIKWYLSGSEDSTIIPSSVLFINGALAGVFSKMVVYPADLIKKRSMLSHFSHDRKTFGSNPKCETIRMCIESTFKNEGIFGFYKGMTPTLYKSGVMSAFYFSVYDTYNYYITKPYQRYEEAKKMEENIRAKKKDR